uniref:Uncharacterized protein n=1 Tax=Caenorhabditis tropicalis TaxID=1561998 RepID=A0A1I7TXG8_9PELO
MAFEPSHRSPLLTAARASEKFWVPIERMGGFEVGESQGFPCKKTVFADVDDGAKRWDSDKTVEAQRPGGIDDDDDGRISDQETGHGEKEAPEGYI